MKQSVRRIFCTVLSLVLLITAIPLVSARQCRTDNFNSGYELSGYGPEDMIAIAFMQLGKTGTQMGYSEEWCADFVSDCAILAGQTEAIPAFAYCYGLYYAILEAGGKKTTSSPKPGDICFINWDGGTHFQHVELVYKVEDGMVYTIGGNTGGGSNLYARKVALHDPLSSNVIVTILRPDYKVLDISYATKCTSYDTYCSIRIKTDTTLMSQPCDSQTDGDSTLIKTLGSGKELKVYAVVENTLGQLWYRVKNGDNDGYIRATDTEFMGEIPDSISISNLTAPAKLTEGNSFRLEGKISSKGIPLSTVTGTVSKGNKEIMSVKDTIGADSCQLRSTAVNRDLKFSTLKSGEYIFTITASAKGYYADGDSLKSFTLNATLYSEEFTVQGHTCEFEFAYIEAEHPHITVYTCTGCGERKREKEQTNLLEDCLECYPEPEPTSPVPLPANHNLYPEVICFHPFFTSCLRCSSADNE